MSEIFVVTGLPRSGTSLMMQIFNKSGIPILSDGKRTKDINNPEGYYELEAVKGIVGDNSFLNSANGKVVKIVAPLPIYMNPKLRYRVVFMRREIEEIMISQEKMLEKNQNDEREKYRTIYEFHLKKTYRFLEENGIPFIDIHYNALMSNPETVLEELKEFFKLDKTIGELAEVVNPELYRNRSEK